MKIIKYCKFGSSDMKQVVRVHYIKRIMKTWKEKDDQVVITSEAYLNPVK